MDEEKTVNLDLENTNGEERNKADLTGKRIVGQTSDERFEIRL